MLWSLVGCFAWCLVASGDMVEIRWDYSCVSCSEIVFGIFTSTCHIRGSWIAYSACVTCFLAALGTSRRSLFIAVYCPTTQIIPLKLVFSIVEKVEERVSSSFAWDNLTQGFTVLVSNSGYDPLAGRCLSVTTQASLVMIRSAARLTNFTQEIKGLQTLPVALVLKYWLCEAHGKSYLLRLTLIQLRQVEVDLT